jgi:Ca2+-binding RTX toxin-like protein
MNPRITAIVAAAAVALTAAGASAPGADAATTCKFSDGLVEVRMTQHKDSASFATASGTIGIGGADGPVTCSGGTPTTRNTDSVLILDRSDNLATAAGNDGSTRVSIHEPVLFGPGKTDEPFGEDEIEFYVDTLNGYDELTLGGLGRQDITVGNDGANWTFDDDADMIGMPFDDIRLFAFRSADNMSGQGGRGTGAPLSTAKYFGLKGEDGNDRLLGSDIAAGDDIQGEEGNDTIEGGAGDDRIRAWRGDDNVKGGAGADTILFTGGAAQGATVDLNQTGAQTTGEGTDTLAEIENVVGSDFADTLVGTAGVNVLDGGVGDDRLDGRGGADELRGGTGTDAVSYARAPGAVTIDLGRITQVTDGDRLYLVEDVIGSPFGDTLTGNIAANRIVGGAGTDTVAAGAGADRVEVRDGERDRVTCGADRDIVLSDRRTLDSIDGQCETVDALPEPTQDRAGTNTPDRELRFTLTGATTQRVLRQKSVRVRVRCPLEACSTLASASGKLGRVRKSSLSATKLTLGPLARQIRAGATTTLALRLSKTQIAALHKAVAAGRRPTLKVTVTAHDAAGNGVTRTLRVKTKR